MRTYQVALIAVVSMCAFAVGACTSSGGGTPTEIAGHQLPKGQNLLPTVPNPGNVPLPTAAGGASDTVVVTEPATTTSVPVTTTWTSTTTTTVVIPPVIAPSDILFDTDSAVLKPDGVTYLTGLAKKIMSEYPNASLHFVGHTDSRGSAQYNLDLSRRRAAAVLAFFQQHGFSTNKLSSDGVGFSQPLVPDRDTNGNFLPSAGQKNRCVAIDIAQAEP